MSLVTMKELLDDAIERNYCVGMFDAMDYSMAKSIVRTAERLNSPVMLATAEVLLAYESLEYIAATFKSLAKEATVPVCLFLDHGESYEVLVKGIAYGFTGVMYDGSTKNYETNIQRTQEIKKVADVFGCSVEAELGKVSGSEVELGDVEGNVYTDPEQAEEFVERTGIDALAVAIGNVHGLNVVPDNLQIDLLKQINERVDVPLVLHGGSGLTEDEVSAAISNGICKFNIWSDLIKTYQVEACKEKNKDLWYGDWMVQSSKAVEKTVENKIRQFGSIGKA